MLTTAVGVIQEEGLLKLWTGITPALYRHVIYSGSFYYSVLSKDYCFKSFDSVEIELLVFELLP